MFNFLKNILVKVVFSFFLSLLVFGFVNAQNTHFSRKIIWESPKTISHYFELNQKDYNKTSFLSFEKASYSDPDALIPYYYELIRVNVSDARVSVSNVNYQELTKEELGAIKKSKVSPELKFTYNVSYKRKQAYIQFNLLPFRLNSTTGKIEKVISFSINIISGRGSKKTIRQNPINKFASESILKNGRWVKMRYNKTGIYKLTYSKLIELGFSNPSNVRIYGNSSGVLPISNSETCPDDLINNSIFIEKGSDGVFNSGDYILFYAKGPDQWTYDEIKDFYSCKKHVYSDYNYIFLSDIGSINNVSTVSTPGGNVNESISSFTDYAHHEKEKINLKKTGQLWLGEDFDSESEHNFTFDFPNRIKSIPMKIRTSLVARSSSSSTFKISSGGSLITTSTISGVNMSSYTETYARKKDGISTFSSNENSVVINVRYEKPTPSSEGYIDFLTVNAKRSLRLVNKPLRFNYYNNTASDKIIEFRIENANTSTKIWNITSLSSVKNLNQNNQGSYISVKTITKPGLNEFVAFNSNYEFNSLEFEKNVQNQNLHAINHRDMIIVSHPNFLTQANEIARFHESKDNLSTIVVTPEQIFNEFSSGARDASAIRNFVKMIYERSSNTDTLKYLLLIGDGSFDHKSITADNINYVLTYQSVTSLSPSSSFVTDDFFGLLDNTDNVESGNSGLVDIGIGRLPVKTTEEAQKMVEKIKIFSNPENYGNWIHRLCFVGDDENGNIHMEDADRLASFVDTTYSYFFINKIYLDAFQQESAANSESYPEVNRLINDQINNGVLIFNYTGHGGEHGLAHERVVSIADINSWVNSKRLAIFVTATCEFSRFDNHTFTSAGEFALLNPNGGSVALFTTTRLVYSGPNFYLNRHFYDYVFERDYRGNYRALGDIIRLAKNVSGVGNNKRNFVLLGDPALKIPMAELNAVTDSINHRGVDVYTDTLNALSKVTIHGHIENSSKTPIDDYNGVIYPLVLDKHKSITTLANDGGENIEFLIQKDILFKGKVSVKNGKFNYTFIVPKDISYNYDYGKITYFSNSSYGLAKGYFDEFIIGGSNENAIEDRIGPDIKLYMNEESFVSGGVTNENPTLYALVNDSSGINTVGNGIGHDITVTLDDNTNNLIILNDYYESEIDNYQKGRIEYLFDELEEGNHSLNLKVWDVYNNSSEKKLDFIVAKSEKLAIKNLLNYPNPFTENTAFYFDHNRINENLDILIQIFTVSGKLIKTINTTINSNSFRSEPIHWDGLDDFGDKIGRGIYIYRIKVRTTEGEIVTKTEKLVILK